MQLGITLPNSGPLCSVEAMTGLAQSAERMNFDSVWFHDHVTMTAEDAKDHFAVGSADAWAGPVVPNVFEVMTTLGYLAAATSVISLGSAVIVLPLRHPVWLAKMAATVDQLSSGRLILGVGVGSANLHEELAAVGRSDFSPHVGAVTDEWIEVLQAIWREPTYSASKRFIQVKDATVYPKPAQDAGVPLWIGGRSPAAIRRTARFGDGWLPIFVSPEEYRTGRRQVEELVQGHGRAAGSVRFGSMHWISIDRDGALAARRARSRLSRTAALRDTSEDRTSIVGDPDAVAERIASYRESGVEHMVLLFVTTGVEDMLERMQILKESVVPALSC